MISTVFRMFLEKFQLMDKLSDIFDLPLFADIADRRILGLASIPSVGRL